MSTRSGFILTQGSGIRTCSGFILIKPIPIYCIIYLHIEGWITKDWLVIMSQSFVIFIIYYLLVTRLFKTNVSTILATPSFIFESATTSAISLMSSGAFPIATPRPANSIIAWSL